MLWVVLTTPLTPLLPASPKKSLPALPPATAEALRGIATWCLQFTPRVALVEGCAVALEVWSSLRLFRGEDALKARIAEEAPALGVIGIGWAPTAMGALVLARCGVSLDGRPLTPVLDQQPLLALTAAAEHAGTLAHAGINTLGQLRVLPRNATGRRFSEQLLVALDQAYGRRPEVFEWQQIPEDFLARLELPAREDQATALMEYAKPLLMQMCGWLAARHAGAEGFRFTWIHDSMRAKDAGDGGQLVIRSSTSGRNLNHFTRLLSEHLAKTELLAPVGELKLEAVGVERVTEESLSLLPKSMSAGEALTPVLEQIAARLGEALVVQPLEVDDHRPECRTRWDAFAKRRARKTSEVDPLPAPTFLLPEPLRLAVSNERPQYQGTLYPILGPERVEGGWWDRVPGEAGVPGTSRHVERDYWVAVSKTAGKLWIFSTRQDDGTPAWYLHGIFG
ncbi:protein ImuB [Pelomonas saccharophila]|uniref:Protein ImuB n=1 Tax=Roseateles saccharophilus TaxID=304 RepID=A0ABU1YW98_ROSSA|nr:DNA polymerase Y family protein [Roseateles saccharophilus]MDR7273145.1 protein ImuB [Roseateles saccharophilus]